MPPVLPWSLLVARLLGLGQLQACVRCEEVRQLVKTEGNVKRLEILSVKSATAIALISPLHRLQLSLETSSWPVCH